VKDNREFGNNTASILLCDEYLTTLCKTSFIISRKVASYLAETVRKIILRCIILVVLNAIWKV